MSEKLVQRYPEKVQNPQNYAVNNRSGNAVNNYGAGYCEHFCADSHNKALRLKFYSGRGHRVCEARNGNKRARARLSSYFVVNAQRRKKYARENQRDRCNGSGGDLVKPLKPQQLVNILSGGAYTAADKKRPYTAKGGFAFWGGFFNDF